MRDDADEAADKFAAVGLVARTRFSRGQAGTLARAGPADRAGRARRGREVHDPVAAQRPVPRSAPVTGSAILVCVLGAVTPTDPGLNQPGGVRCDTGDSSVIP